MKEAIINKVHLCKREGLKGCLYNGGGFGIFIGEILKNEDNKYLFKRVYISYISYEGFVEENKEDHIWVIDGKAFKAENICVGDYVSFAGEVYLYKRKNGTYELGIKNPSNIKKVNKYEIPSDEDLDNQFIQKLTCEACKCRNQCYGVCINDDWAKSFQDYLKEVNKLIEPRTE